MSHTPLFSSDTRKSAYIRDDALILYFETAETPLVARFDLDSLVQANFEVVKKDEIFALVLRDFSGQRQEITTFANKADAHQALYAILQALLSYGENKKGSSKPSLLWKFVKWLLIGFAIATIAALTLIWFATPVSVVPSATAPIVQQNGAAGDTVREDVPQGEPMNMDEFISPALNVPAPEDTQTGITTPTEMPASETEIPQPAKN